MNKLIQILNQGIANYTKAIDINPMDVEAYIGRGGVHFTLGQFKQAIENFDQAIRLDPNVDEVYLTRGSAHAHLGQYNRAIEDYSQVIRFNPVNAEAYQYRGVVYYHLGQYQKAIENFDQAIRLDPNVDEVYYTRGIAHVHLGQYQKAIEDFTKAINLDLKGAGAYNGRAAAFSALAKFPEAIKDLTSAIHRDPKCAISYENRGKLYGVLGENLQAESDYRMVMQLKSENKKDYEKAISLGTSKDLKYSQMNYHILCVDDEKIIGEMLVEFFRNNTNCRIAHAINANEAFEYLENNRVDLVITNQRMDGMDGLTMTNVITKKYPAKVIVFTGGDLGGERKEAFHKGAKAFILKPLEFDALLEIIYKVMTEGVTYIGNGVNLESKNSAKFL